MFYEAKKFKVKGGLEVTLKTPEKSEAREVLDFIRNVTGQTDYLLSVPEDFSADAECEAKFIEANIASGNYFIAVYADGRIIGDCNINFNTHIKDRHRSNVGIAIDKDYWGLGIGSLIFDELIRLAKENGVTEQIELGVIDKNERALSLYRKKGFVKAGSIPRALKLADGSYLDEDFMVRYL